MYDFSNSFKEIFKRKKILKYKILNVVSINNINLKIIFLNFTGKY